MATPGDGYNSGIQRVEIGSTSTTDGKWSSSNVGGVVSLGTYLTGERYPTTVSAVSSISNSGGSALFVFASTDYDDGDQVVASGFTGNSGYVNGTWTVVKASPLTATLKDSAGTTVTWLNVGSATDTGTFTFTHLSRGYFVVRDEGGGGASVTKMEDWDDGDGASGNGTAIAAPSSKMTFQAVANGSSGAFTAVVTIKGSNDGTNFETLGTISLSGTATTADSDGFAVDAAWAWIRADYATFAGTGRTCKVYVGY